MTKNLISSNSIYFQSEAYRELTKLISTNNYSSIFVLVDGNTQQHCLAKFLQQVTSEIPIEVIEIETGEDHKTLETCMGVWNVLSEMGADRKSLLINLGGGVITDLGGFIASLFKRGIDFIHVPTSLLAMVDAAIGGKNGANLGHLKNQIGTINPPGLIIVDSAYLETLPQNQLKSGLAEMLKHGLIYRAAYWKKMSDLSKLSSDELGALIQESIEIKTTIVAQDPKENGLRKILNFGHTLGHAIESYFLSNTEKTTLLHGEAIAIGMIMESYLSHKIEGLPEEMLLKIKNTILHSFKKVDFQEEDIAPIIKLMEHDKKNVKGKINFVLLKEIGTPLIDRQVENKHILAAFDYYAS